MMTYLSESGSLMTTRGGLDYHVDKVLITQLLCVYTEAAFSHPGCPQRSLSLASTCLMTEGLVYQNKGEIVWIISLTQK